MQKPPMKMCNFNKKNYQNITSESMSLTYYRLRDREMKVRKKNGIY